MFKRPQLLIVLVLALVLFSAPAIAMVPGASVGLTVPQKNISLIPIEYSPYPAQPNQLVHLWIKVENYGQEPFEDAHFKLIEKYPFSLTRGDTGILSVGTITGKGTRLLEYDVLVDKDAVGGYHDLHIGLCNDKSCKDYSKMKFQIFVNTGGEARIEAFLDNSDLIYAGQTGEISISIINKGVLNIRYLIAEIEDSDDYKIISPKRTYIGELRSDDFETLDVKLHINENLASTQKIEIPITLEFSDINEREYLVEQNVHFQIYSKEDLLKYSLIEKSNSSLNSIIVILVLLLAATGYFVWKRKRNKNA